LADRYSRCDNCSDPREPFLPCNLSDAEIDAGQRQNHPATADCRVLLPKPCNTHPVCGKCRGDQLVRRWNEEREDFESWSNGSSGRGGAAT
jgi:hypothetical protein